MNAGQALAMTAALLMAAPPPAAQGGRVIWVGLCDAAHSGALVPIPLNRDKDQAPAKACHAACGTMPDRRTRR